MSYITWYNEIYIEITCLLFCFDGWALTLFVSGLRQVGGYLPSTDS